MYIHTHTQASHPLGQSSVDGCVGCFHAFVIGNSGLVNTEVHISFHIRIFIFSIYIYTHTHTHTHTYTHTHPGVELLNICKHCDKQGVNIQDINRAHIIEYLKENNKNGQKT